MANEVEVMESSVISALNRSEIESQIEVAKRFPRSMTKFKDGAVSMACIDEETAASCIYRRPVGKENGKMKFAEGMSIRMAEIVGANYGNLRVYATLLSQTDRQVVARGMAMDLEGNFASSSEVVEATVTSEGKPYSERMRAVVAKAALAKARRDATFQVVPRALAKPVETAVRQLLLGNAKSLDTRREQVTLWIKALNIDEDRVWSALGIGGLADLGIKELETLTGLRTAIKDGETTIDEAFPSETIASPQVKAPEIKKGRPAGSRTQKEESNTPESGTKKVAPSAGVAESPTDQQSKPASQQEVQEEEPKSAEKGAQSDSQSQSPEKPPQVGKPWDDNSLSIKERVAVWIKHADKDELNAKPSFLSYNFSKLDIDDQVKLCKEFDIARRSRT